MNLILARSISLNITFKYYIFIGLGPDIVTLH